MMHQKFCTVGKAWGWIALVMTFACPAPLMSAMELPKDSIEFDNAYVRVMRNSSVSESSREHEFEQRVIVALSSLSIQAIAKDTQLVRGQTLVFLPQQKYAISSGDYFEIAIKTNRPTLAKPEQWLEPEKNTVVYEDQTIRVFDERLAPGDVRALHSHAQRLVVRLNRVKLTDPRFSTSSKPTSGLQVPNTVKFAEPIVHVVKNTSDIPLFNIVIEFKIDMTK